MKTGEDIWKKYERVFGFPAGEGERKFAEGAAQRAKLRGELDPHAHLADPASPEFNPLEYKRLTGSLPRVAQEAARKLKLIED